VKRIVLVAAAVAAVASSTAGAAPLVKGPAYTWGLNTHGQLGLGYSSNDVNTPTKVVSLGQVRGVAAGQRHTLAARKDGTIWAFGDNTAGQLGNGTTDPAYSPVQVTGLASATAVAAGWDHSLALRADGTVWAWGGDYAGQLGDGQTTTERTPVQVPGLANIIAIAAGHTSSFAIGADGTLWAWGGNEWGQLGDGSETSHLTPEPVLTAVSAVSAGEVHTLAVRSDGTVWAWGNDSYDQLGFVPPDPANPAQLVPAQVAGIAGATGVAAGYTHSLAVLGDGSVLAWGDNTYGQLGNGSSGEITPTPAPVTGLSGITAVAAGWVHSLALAGNGHVYAWGSNFYGQLGTGSTDPGSQLAPVEVAQKGFSAIAVGEAHDIGF
jgi:alpha-tubulin suppressor-like RCC1 family protein